MKDFEFISSPGSKSTSDEIAWLKESDEKTKKKLASQDRSILSMQDLVHAIVLVVVLMVAIMLVDVWQNKEATYRSFLVSLNEKENTYQQLLKEVSDIKTIVGSLDLEKSMSSALQEEYSEGN